MNQQTGKEYNENCGLSKDEWEIEQIVDKVREVSTLHAIGILRKWKEQQLPAGISNWVNKLKEESGIYGYDEKEKLEWIQTNVINPLSYQLESLQDQVIKEQEESKRLKGLMEKLYRMYNKTAMHESQLNEYWQQFKTENQL